MVGCQVSHSRFEMLNFGSEVSGVGLAVFLATPVCSVLRARPENGDLYAVSGKALAADIATATFRQISPAASRRYGHSDVATRFTRG